MFYNYALTLCGDIQMHALFVVICSVLRDPHFMLFINACLYRFLVMLSQDATYT